MDKTKIWNIISYLTFAISALIVGLFIFFYWSQISNIVSQLYGDKPTFFSSIFPKILDASIIILETIIFLYITKPILQKYLEHKGKKNQSKLIIAAYTYIVWFIIVIILLFTFFKDFGAIITSLGLIGFGVTFALQKPIMNFVGWVTIITTNPFNLGEKIEVNNIKGEVKSIHLMYTRIQGSKADSNNKSEQIITIPNELILTNPILNYSRNGGLYTDEITFSITYESNWRKAAKIVEEITEENVKKFVKTQVPVTFAEKRAWQEALNLLQEASKKIKRDFLKKTVKEQINIMKTVESSNEVPIPKPKIHIKLEPASIGINVIYQTDLDAIAETKATIIKDFLEKIEKHEDIKLAHPRMEIIKNENKEKEHHSNKKLKEFLQ
jgi:small-conductance mechanosensitive channel